MKKLIALFAALAVLSTGVFAAQIYKTEEEIFIAEGVTLTKVKSFYSDHNLSYSYIKADLSNENVGLKLLTPYTGSDSLDTVGNIAASYPGTVAAMNADFFSTVKSGKALSLGIEIQDGKLLQSPINPDTMATIYEKDGVVDMSYLGFNIMVVAPNWEYAPIAHLNKHTSYYGAILMYTSDFNGGYSPAPGGEVVEVVVEDGVIKEFRRNMPPVKIPENGCVLVVSEGSSMFLANNFAVGDPVKFDYYVTPDILSSDTAFGGGAMLVSDGKVVTSFSHTIAGYNPRSAVGIDKSGKTLYLVAVNGRTTESRGMTMSELAALMADLGCYKAVNLDGGGSTNMVASTVWAENIHTVNKPSENRRVVNAVGISYSSEPGSPAGIVLESDAPSVFIGQSTKISYAVYDENKRPVSADVTFSSDGGEVAGGYFTGHKGGPAVIRARSGNATGEITVYVIDDIAGIETERSVTLAQGATYDIPMIVFDDAGHRCSVYNYAPFTFGSSDPSVAYAENGVIHAVGNGNAVISVSKGNAVSHIGVSVGSTPYDYSEDFEAATGEFSSYPAYVGGDWSLSEEFSHSGSASGMLYYDFTADTDDTKAAYFSLSSPVRLADDESAISLYAKTAEGFSHSLKALLTDKNGKAVYISFKKDSEGDFAHYTAEIPKDAARPISLSKIYVAALAGEEKDEGYVYFDDLSFRAVESAPLPYVPMNGFNDPMEKAGAGRTFAVGSAEKSDTILSKLAREKMTAALAGSSAFALFGIDNSSALNKRNAFYKAEDEDALYISVNAGSGGIRKADSSQWDKIASAVGASDKKNIFILSETAVLSSDSFENEAAEGFFKNLADGGRNVFVIERGSKNSLKIIDGVRYFTLADVSENAATSTKIGNYSYLEFSFGNSVTYTWKRVF